MIELSDALWTALDTRGNRPEDMIFDAVMDLDGEEFRHQKNRRTIRVTLGDRRYFLKTHDHTGWPEILKNVLRARIPVVTARPEVEAIDRLAALGVPTVSRAGHGWRGRSPARRQSFVITDALENARDVLDLTRHLDGVPPRTRVILKRRLLGQVAEVAAKLHDHGLNHRDFYLNHFLVPDRDWTAWRHDERLDVRLIDLHRLQIRRRVPRRYVAKDLSGLLFSSFDAGITTNDCLRFLRIYWGADWRGRVRRSRRLRELIVRRARRLYRAEHGKPPPLPPGLASFA